MRYRTKLHLSFGLVLLLPLLVAGGLSLYWSRESALHEVRIRLREAADGFRADVAAREGRLLRTAAALSADADLRRALASSDRGRLLPLLERWSLTGALDVVEAGDAAGRVRARGHNPADFGEDKSAQPVVAAALAGRPAADFERGASGLAIRAVAPVRAPDAPRDAPPVGTIMVGDRIDSDFVARYARLTGVEIALFEGARPAAATDPRLAGLRAGGAEPADGLFRGGDGTEWSVAVAPILRADGERFGSIAAARDVGEVTRFLRNVSRALWVGLGAGGVLAAVLSFLLARSFTRPLVELGEAIRGVEEEGGPVEIAVDRDDEFGALERRFNRMAGRLADASGRIARIRRARSREAQRALADRIVAEVAHEIRNPLNAMAAQVELLRTRAPDGDAARRIAVLADEIRRLDRTVEDIVAAAGPLRIERAPADVAALLEALLSLLERTLEEKRIEIVRRFDPAVGTVPLDARRIHQALMNVLLNAIESMEGPGALTVEAAIAGDRVRISVSDRGRGMSVEEQDALFDAYFTTKEDGMGLGLPVAMRIVEAHGGTIEIESRPGTGTRVDVVLPRGEHGREKAE